MRNKTAITKNIMRYVVAMSASAEDLIESNEGMAILRGDAGSGKTHSTTYVAIKTGGSFIRAQRIWSEASMLSAIVKELKGKQSRFRQTMFDQSVELLKKSQKPLFIDEADYLTLSMLDILRDIHDIARVPVVIICMEDLRNGLIHNQRFRRRITSEIELLPLDEEDAVTVARTICEATLAPDLFALLFKMSAGNIGLFRNGLAKVEKMIVKNGWDWNTPVTRDQWGDRSLIIGGANGR